MKRKVAIIGGGICGLYLAWKLAQREYKIILFERKKEIGKKSCSGLVSERLFHFLPEAKKLIKREVSYVLIHFPRKTIKVRFQKNIFLISHYQLDRLVAQMARKSGAEFILGKNIGKEEINSLRKEFSKIIGCDGAHSQVREFLGLKSPGLYFAALGFLKEKGKANYLETWPHQSDGFIWRIEREGEIEYGVLGKGKKTRKSFEEFLEKRKLNLEKINFATIPQGLTLGKEEDIALGGDAAGLTKPWSGGGIVWSLIGAQILLNNFQNLQNYRKEMRMFFLPRIFFSKIAKKIVYFAGFHLPLIFPKNFTIDSDFLR